MTVPDPIGCGSILALATDLGSLAFVDSVQSLDQPSHGQRQATIKGLINGVLSPQKAIP